MLWIEQRAVSNSCIALTGAQFAAITGLSPLSYWTLAGNDANTLHDYGSLGINLTQGSATVVPLAAVPGMDGGCYYAATPNGVIDSNLIAADSLSYEPQTASGLTVMYLWKSNGNTGGVPVVKNSAVDSSWDTNIGNVSATIQARILTSGGTNARARTATAAASLVEWEHLVFRFSGSSTTHPTIRLNGTNIAGTTSGSGTGNSNSVAPVRLFGTGTSTNHPSCALAHVAIFAGMLSDANCATIEAAATTDGW